MIHRWTYILLRHTNHPAHLRRRARGLGLGRGLPLLRGGRLFRVPDKACRPRWHRQVTRRASRRIRGKLPGSIGGKRGRQATIGSGERRDKRGSCATASVSARGSSGIARLAEISPAQEKSKRKKVPPRHSRGETPTSDSPLHTWIITFELLRAQPTAVSYR